MFRKKDDAEEDGDETDSEFYDSDFDAEDGDDDLFLEYTDKDVNDNNEISEIVEEEDDAGLDHDDLELTREQHMQLKYKFKEFNPEADMAAPVEVECTSSWEWFLTTLKEDLNITNTSPFTIMSDKQKVGVLADFV